MNRSIYHDSLQAVFSVVSKPEIPGNALAPINSCDPSCSPAYDTRTPAPCPLARSSHRHSTPATAPCDRPLRHQHNSVARQPRRSPRLNSDRVCCPLVRAAAQQNPGSRSFSIAIAAVAVVSLNSILARARCSSMSRGRPAGLHRRG